MRDINPSYALAMSWSPSQFVSQNPNRSWEDSWLRVKKS